MATVPGADTNRPPPWSRKGWALFVTALVALALAIVSPITPWYTISNEVHNWTVENATFDLNTTTTFYPGSNYRFLCDTYPVDAPVWGEICTLTHQEAGGTLQPYQDIVPFSSHPESSDLQTMYSIVWIASIFSISIGFFALALFVLDQRQRRPDWRVTLGAGVAFAVATAFTLGAAIGVAALQPSAVIHDLGPGGGTVVGGSTFWGSCGPSATQCGMFTGAESQSFLWGPALGWYAELAAGAILLGLATLVLRDALRLRRTARAARASPGKP